MITLSEDDIRHCKYNIKDILATFEVANYLEEALALEDQAFKDYLNFKEKEVVKSITKVMHRGVKIDLQKKEEFTIQLEALAKEAEEKINWIVGEEINIRSTPQIKSLFVDLLKVKPETNRKSGSDTFGSAAMLIYLEKYPEYATLIRLILEYRSINIFLRTFLRAKVDSDNYIRSSFNVAGTRSERLASRKNPFGRGCMPTKDTYAYTPSGWKLISEKPPIIAQYNINGSLEFVPATWNIYTCAEDLYSYSGRCFRGLFTKEHRIVKSKRNKLHIQTMGEVFSLKGSYQVPVTGELVTNSEQTISDSWLQAEVIYSADGNYEQWKASWRISVKKQRKKDRLYTLFNKSEKDSQKDKPGYLRLSLPWENYSKNLPSWFLDLPLRQRKLIIEELKHWDAHIRKDSFLYFTTIPDNAYLVQTLCHITGYSASVSIDETNSNEHGNTSTKPLYIVNVSTKQLNTLDGFRWDKKYFSGEVGCPTVASGMWLVKYDNGIHVTGNCNFQNLPEKGKIDIRYALMDIPEDENGHTQEPEGEILDYFHVEEEVKLGILKLPNLKTMFIPEEDEVFWNFDLSAADARVVAFTTQCKFLMDVFNSGAEDVYSFVASEYYRKKITKELFPKERQIFKAVCHGTNYFGGANTIAALLGLSVEDVRRVQQFYFRLCPEIALWHEEVRSIIFEKNMLTNVWGARGWFLNLQDKMVLNKALAWLGSSPVSILINKMMVELDNKEPELPIRFQVHDSLAGTAKKTDVNFAERILSTCKIAIPFETPIYIPIDIKTSEKSYGDCK